MSKASKIPHTFVIIALVLLFCGVLTWIVPSGEFARERIVVDGVEREVIVNDSYHHVSSSPQSWQILGSIVDGFKKQAGIIAFILIIGGAFQILNSTKAIDFAIASFVKNSSKFERFFLFRKIGVNNVVIILTMLIFSLFGAVFGMSEETIAFVIIFVPLAVSMGYDSITGVLMVYVAAHIGFSGAIFNPFTIGIAQGLSGLPIFSGFEYRAFVWLILTVAIILFTLFYARKIKWNPKASPTYNIDSYWRERVAVKGLDRESSERETFNGEGKKSLAPWVSFLLSTAILVVCSALYPKTLIEVGGKGASLYCLPMITVLYIISSIIAIRKSTLFYILNILIFTIVVLIVGVLGYDWYISEIASLFLGMGIATAIASSTGANKTAVEFLNGAKDILSAAIIVGFAGGIIEILTNGKIMDTILFSLAGGMENMDKTGTVSVMYGIQTIINIFIPSGSAKAALTIPIMAPFSDVVGLSRQATVLAYQLGDGFTNMITPTSGVLMGVLGVAKIPYSVWVKWFWKILLCFIILGLLLLIPSAILSLNGF